MKEEKPIIIDNFQRGVAPSEFVGHSVMAGYNFEKLGLLRGANISYEGHMTGLTGSEFILAEYETLTVIGKADDHSYHKILSSRGNEEDFGYTLGNKHFLDIVYYNGNYYVLAENKVAELNGTSLVWDNSKMTLPYIASAPLLLVGSDDILYIGSGDILSSFDGTSFTSTALSLPKYAGTIYSMIEYGDDMLIATENNKNITIFSWDRQSNFANVWAVIQDKRMVNMGVVNNVVYILCGNNYNLYASNGSSVTKVCTFGKYVRTRSGKNSEDVFWLDSVLNNRNAFYCNNNKVFVGTWFFSGNASPVTDYNSPYPFGLFYYDTITGVVGQENAGVDDLTLKDTYYGVYYISDDGYPYSMKYNVNTKAITRGYGGTRSFESQVFDVGNTNKPKTFNRLKINMMRDMKNDLDSTTIYYRTNLSDDWVELGNITQKTVLNDNDKDSESKEFPFAVTCENLQIKVVGNWIRNIIIS